MWGEGGSWKIKQLKNTEIGFHGNREENVVKYKKILPARKKKGDG